MVIGNFYKILTIGNTTDANWATVGSTSGNPVVGEVFKALAVTLAGSSTGTIAQVAEASAYDTTKKLTVAGNAFTVDQIMEGTVTGAHAMVVEHTGGVVSYIQNESTGFGFHSRLQIKFVWMVHQVLVQMSRQVAAPLLTIIQVM